MVAIYYKWTLVLLRAAFGCLQASKVPCDYDSCTKAKPSKESNFKRPLEN